MNASNGDKKNGGADVNVTAKWRNKQLLPALMAVGGACGVMAGTASALELGDLDINSSLGQPLRAGIAFALNPREEIHDYCVYLRPGLAANGLPAVTEASIRVADGVILVTGSRAVREPLLTMQLSIDCPNTAHISREYTLMLNPPQPRSEAPVAVESPATPTVVARPPKVFASKPQPPVGRSGSQVRSPVSEGSRYLTQRGDSLSEIAERISDRSIALWPAVDRIFAANPDAFMDGDMNRLKAGSWLDIPDFSIAPPEPAVAAIDGSAAAEPHGDVSEVQAYGGYQAPAVSQPSPTGQTGPAESQVDTRFVGEPETSTFDPTEALAGEPVAGGEDPFVSPLEHPADDELYGEIVIPDTEIIQPTAADPVAVVKSGNSETGGAWSWLLWLGGTGLALILGLLLFGQKLRQRFGSVAIAAPSEPLPSRRNAASVTQEAITTADVDLEVSTNSLHSSSITLDADFDDGSGLQDTSDMDVAQDFGFSASTTFDDELDLELPEATALEDKLEGTDIIPPLDRIDEDSILDSEVPPSDDDSQYDMSMIVDATKQNVGDPDATAMDLHAVPVEVENDTGEPGDHSLNEDVDYKILEQDYEEEYTATQALNDEIEKAAAELAERMETDTLGEITTELPKNTQAQNDPDLAVEMPSDDDDMVVDIEVDSGKADSKMKAS
ncbi:MAG: FimV family protein [Woeseia sp.]